MNLHNTSRKTTKRNATGFTIKVVLDDTVPAFGGYKLGSLKNGTATVLLNAHACKEAAPDAELSVKEMVIETLMHEFGHCLEEYFELESSEIRVESSVERYRFEPSEERWSISNPANCDLCGTEFDIPSRLDKHMREKHKEPQPGESLEGVLDTVLGICATYGTPHLGTEDQQPFIEGFKHSQTYKEAKQALTHLERLAELRGRIAHHKITSDKWVEPNVGQIKFGSWLHDTDKDLQAELNRLEGARPAISGWIGGIWKKRKRTV